MGFWPFNRKTSRKKTLSGAGIIPSENFMDPTGPKQNPGKGRNVNNGTSGPALDRKRSDGSLRRRRSRRNSKKLLRDPEKRAYSFSPARNDSITVPRDAHQHHPVPPLPPAYNKEIENIAPDDEKSGLRTHRPISGNTILAEVEDDTWQRVPTLHKRSAKDSTLSRRKSSKRRKADHDREEEIRAMGSSVPPMIRPSGQSATSSRPSKKDSKRLRGGLDHPPSTLSLPLPESVHSSILSGRSEGHASYKVSAIDALSPRPTIKYAENPRCVSGGPASDRSDSRRRRVSDRIPITQEVMKAHKRVEDLADDLDAGDLREIMERDQRRRERKKASDMVKMERRLARRAEKQRSAEAEAAANGTAPPKNMDRGVAGRELMDIDTTPKGKATKRKGSDSIENGRVKQPSEPWREDSTTLHKDPFSDEHQNRSPAGTSLTTPTDEHEVPEYGTAKVARLSRASMQRPNVREHLRNSSNVSEVFDLRRPTADSESTAKPEASRRDSGSSGRQPQSWTSFFKRTATKNKGRSATPSSFSNTSRDSVARSSTSVKPPSVGFGLARQISGVPKRTMSKFREDLPELPMSPPDSRVQSPETDPSSVPISARVGGNPFADPVVGRHDTPTSGHRTMDISPEPVAATSQSLASIDSEASWLSGRRAGSKRGSMQTPLPYLQDSAESLQRRYREYAESGEEMGIAEDEYFGRLTPGPDDMLNEHRRVSGNPMPSSDEEDNGSGKNPSSPTTKWHGGIARKPTLIRHEDRVKSVVVSLNDFTQEASSEPAGGVHRATSIDFGKGQGHARQISAGSAKLLDLKPLSGHSVDSKSRSHSRGESRG